MNLKLLSMGLALLFLFMLVPVNSQAGYVLAISGKSDFIAPPFEAVNFNTTDVYIRIYLSDNSPSSIDIDLSVEGTLGQYISFPDFNGNTGSFTLFPGENERVRYELDFPVSAPGKYYGSILAVGTPPDSEITEGTGAVGKPAISINIVVDVPTDIQIYGIGSSRPGGFPDQQWSSWGNDWSTSFDIINGANETFNGSCDVTLRGSAGTIDSQTYSITNLSGNGGSTTITKQWPDGLDLNNYYEVTVKVYDTNDTFDLETSAFMIPSPAEIISVTKTPEQVFWGDTVAVYATAASSDAALTLNYQVNNGTAVTQTMTYTSGTGEYSAVIPSQDIGSMVYYWVTSANGAFTDRSPDGSAAYSYYVFSPDVPDLTITENDILFTPIDPLTDNMNETDTTVIYITVRNIGRGSASDIPVSILDGETEIWSTTITSIAGDGGSDIVHYSWTPQEGTHILRFEVDGEDNILELDENNNHYTLPEITIYEAPPEIPDDEPQSGSILPYIIIPIVAVILLFLILFLRRKKTINVTVSEVKPFKHPKEGTMRWKYTCSYGAGTILGSTRSTDMNAEVGSVISVKPIGLHENENGTLSWGDAQVMKVFDDDTKPDSEKDIRKLIKKEDK